jgi:hypothetical protein
LDAPAQAGGREFVFGEGHVAADVVGHGGWWGWDVRFVVWEQVAEGCFLAGGREPCSGEGLVGGNRWKTGLRSQDEAATEERREEAVLKMSEGHLDGVRCCCRSVSSRGQLMLYH